MYLWCARCCHAHPRIRWMAAETKYGSCPTCGCSEYRNAVEWNLIAAANGYPEVPAEKEIYHPHPLLF